MINSKANNLIRWGLRIILTIAFFGVMAWIFSNSLKNASQSSEQSEQVTENIMQAIETIDPNVSFGGATEEEDFDILHTYIRDFGHFAEFALLCALCVWCIRAWSPKNFFLFLPIPVSIAIAIFDEYLQTFSDGRAQQFSDVVTDTAGACVGFAFAICALLLISWLYRFWRGRKRRKLRDKYV